MTKERRQDVLIFALIVSIAVHVGLMLYMRPQIMTEVAGGYRKTRSRGPMTVREMEDRPAPVAVEAFEDVLPQKESPEADVDALMPAVDKVSLETQLPEAGLPQFEAPDLSVAPLADVALAPFLSEKIHVDEGVSSFSTPISDDVSLFAPKRPVANDAPVASDEDFVMFTSPTFVPEPASDSFDAPPEEKIADIADIVEKKTETNSYVPAEDILPSVDERVVEQEKAAVRDLLDVRDAAELEGAVGVTAVSAQEGDWVYFKVVVEAVKDLEVVPKDVVVLLDASGSIGNDRLESCRKAARSILRSCSNTGDRFNLVAFRNKFSYAFKNWQECNRESFAKADKWLDNLTAHGRTDVFDVIRSVLTLPRDPARPLIALVVTDGDANAGVKETSQILSKFSALNDGLISVYMYGVKASANRELIDVLTHGNRGESFIYGGRRWNAGTGIEGLSMKFRDPVLTDLRIVFTSGTQAETYPRLLRNLYKGESLPVYGRVPKGVTRVAFSVKGLNGTKPYEGFFDLDLSKVDFDASLPAEWRKELDIDQKLR